MKVFQIITKLKNLKHILRNNDIQKIMPLKNGGLYIEID